MSDTKTGATKKAQPKNTEGPTGPASLLPPQFRDNGPGSPGVDPRRRVWFWVGCMPTVTQTHAQIGGTTFPRLTESVQPRRSGEESSDRIPHIGFCVQLTATQVANIREEVARHIIRFNEPPNQAALIDFTRRGVDLISDRGLGEFRRGHIVRIRTEEEQAKREKAQMPTDEFVREDFDEPLADHLFMVPCPDQDDPRTGGTWPAPMSETDVVFPELDSDAA